MKRSVLILSTLSIVATATTATVLFFNTSKPLKENFQHTLFSEKTHSKEPISPIPETLNLNAQKVLLGEKLFHDTRLSHDNTLSCASCHNLKKGGVDNLTQPITATRQQNERPSRAIFNTPTVFNATFNFVQTWEGHAKTLEQQSVIPLFNSFEMGNKSWTTILDYLNQSPQYQPLLKALYPHSMTAKNVIEAIAEFERSLITPNARFDLYLKGDLTAISPYELKGYQLFKDRGCISCHHGVNVGATMFQKSGVFKPMFQETTLDNQGRANLFQNRQNQTYLKVPSLRNIALTAPYFHNGSVDNLEEAIDIMGKHQLGITLPLEENKKIHAFLKTLTGQYKGQSLSNEE